MAQPSIWTPDMDEAVADGFKNGLSARLIGEQLGVTRNAVLGRTFRLGLCQPWTERRKPKAIAKPREKRKTLARVAFTEHLSQGEVVERIIDLKDLGHTWQDIGHSLNISMQVARHWAIEFGGYIPAAAPKFFTDEERAYIREAWERNDPVEQIADKLDRSFGVIRQTILHMKRAGTVGARDPSKTRLLKNYGEAALAAGATPQEALRKMGELKQIAMAAAIGASKAAKRKHADEALAKMHAALAAGEDRNACVFAARADGVNLEYIGQALGITRERVRQICNAHAQIIAIKGLTQ